MAAWAHRSRHELIFAFKNGAAAHANSFELGQHGRYRTNVWEYRGVNSRGAGRLEELALHPTVKPVAMIVDAIKDVSRRGGIVLDLFGGSGSTLIGAHKTGRRARLCELDPIYCDRILHRWETFTKDEAERIAGVVVNDDLPVEPSLHKTPDRDDRQTAFSFVAPPPATSRTGAAPDDGDVRKRKGSKRASSPRGK
jgi:DNA methylase